MAMSVAERLVAWIWDHRKLSVAICLGVTFLAAWPAQQVRIDNAIDIWFSEEDVGLRAYREFQDRFGNDEVVVIALHQPDGILTPNGVRLLRQVGERVTAVSGVEARPVYLWRQSPCCRCFGISAIPCQSPFPPGCRFSAWAF